MKKGNILYIDDDKISHILVSEALHDKDIEIVYATTGMEAINLFRQNPHFDLVIIELMLPDMDGFIVLEEIRKLNPLVPVIAQTDTVMDDIRSRCLSEGLNHFIEKPIFIKLFVSTVEKYMN